MHFTAGRWTEAESCYREALKRDPGSATAWSKLGVCILKQGDTGAAESCYQRALDADPTFATAWFNLGQIHNLEYRDYPETEKCFRRALEISPRYRSPLLALYHLYTNTGRTDEASEIERQIRALDAAGPVAATPPVAPPTSPEPAWPPPAARLVEAAAPDGARAVMAASGAGESVTIRRAAPPARAAAADELRPASAVYEVRVAGRPGEQVMLALPIDAALLPPGDTVVPLTPQVYDPATRAWRTASSIAHRDHEHKQLLFSIAPDPELARSFRLGYAITTSERTYTSRRFRIHFYPREARTADVVFTDEEWLARLNGTPTGNATRPGVPDFIEDLAVACEQVYDALRAIRDSSGDPVFRELAFPQDVYVRQCGTGGGDAGESALGGPLQISNRIIENRAGGAMNGWEDLTHVLAHEMTHVFQGQYYYAGTFANAWNTAGPGNRWFIEASANYFATLACLPSPAVKREFYAKDSYDRYLFVPLPASEEHSYYAAGLFLEWASDQYAAGLVGDAWARGGGNDLANLDAQLRAHGEPGGLGGAYEKYLRWLMTRPEEVVNFNFAIKESLSARTGEVMGRRGSHENFTQNIAYLRLEHELSPLAAALVSLPVKQAFTTSSLLVCDPRHTSTAAGDVRFLTYDVISRTNAGYENRPPMEAGILNPGVAPSLVPDYGYRRSHGTGFEQLIYNPKLSGCPRVVMEYYLLQPPEVGRPRAGSVSWSTVEVWNIPLEIIAGYNVYADGVKLNRDPVPYAPTRVTFPHPALKATSRVAVSVVDRLGNVWPEYAGIAPPTARLAQGDSLVFTATFSEPINGAPVEIEWKVIGAAAGTIEPDGRYHAPNRPGRFEVEVVNRNNPTQKARAQVEVTAAAAAPAPAVAGPTGGHWHLKRSDIQGGDAAGRRAANSGGVVWNDQLTDGRYVISFSDGEDGRLGRLEGEATWPSPPRDLYPGTNWSGQVHTEIRTWVRSNIYPRANIRTLISAEVWSPGSGKTVFPDLVRSEVPPGPPANAGFSFTVPEGKERGQFLELTANCCSYPPSSHGNIWIIYHYEWVP